MGARWLINLALVAVAALLGAWIALELDGQMRAERLTAVAAEQVTRIVIERAQRADIVLTRATDGWHMHAPHAGVADPTVVARVLALLHAPVERWLTLEPAERAAAGLEPAAIRVRFDALELRVGGVEPLAQRRYVGHGARVAVLDERWLAPLRAEPAAFLLPNPAPPAQNPVAPEE